MAGSKGARKGARDVFINCPFDGDYAPLFRAIVFVVTVCGFRARCSLERADSAENRLEKILNIIHQSGLSIHDISRTELDRKTRLPRFNMPFELGLFLGIRYAGNPRQQEKQCLVLDRARYRYQQFLSDISGQDIDSHDGDPRKIILVVRNWLRMSRTKHVMPSPRAISNCHDEFLKGFPDLLSRMGVHDSSRLAFSDLITIIEDWWNKYETYKPGIVNPATRGKQP